MLDNILSAWNVECAILIKAFRLYEYWPKYCDWV